MDKDRRSENVRGLWWRAVSCSGRTQPRIKLYRILFGYHLAVLDFSLTPIFFARDTMNENVMGVVPFCAVHLSSGTLYLSAFDTVLLLSSYAV